MLKLFQRNNSLKSKTKYVEENMDWMINFYFLSLSKLLASEEGEYAAEKVSDETGLLSQLSKYKLVDIAKSLPDKFHTTYLADFNESYAGGSRVLLEAVSFLMSDVCGRKTVARRIKQSPRGFEVVYLDEIIADLYKDTWERTFASEEVRKEGFNVLFLGYYWSSIFLSGREKCFNFKGAGALSKTRIKVSTPKVVSTDVK